MMNSMQAELEYISNISSLSDKTPGTTKTPQTRHAEKGGGGNFGYAERPLTIYQVDMTTKFLFFF